MSYPIVLLCGPAGVGKDAAAVCFTKRFGAVTIAQADAMKAFVRKVFHFTDEQLWGPSECRNAVDPRYTLREDADSIEHVPSEDWQDAYLALEQFGPEWLREILPGCSDRDYQHAFELLLRWFLALPRNGLSPRLTLQTLGTEFGRKISPNIWSAHAIRMAQKVLAGTHGYSRSYGLLPALPGAMPAAMVVITDGRFRNEILNVKKLGGTVVLLKAVDNSGTDAAQAGGREGAPERSRAVNGS
jgi:hypothetical protein